jgi:hypothetical protein
MRKLSAAKRLGLQCMSFSPCLSAPFSPTGLSSRRCACPFSPTVKVEDALHVLSAFDGRDHVINCLTHSDMRELVCGSVACSVLIQLADGLFLEDESDELLEPAEALEKTRTWLAHI